jgi:hypothetical protein
VIEETLETLLDGFVDETPFPPLERVITNSIDDLEEEWEKEIEICLRHFISKYNFSFVSQIDKKKTFFFPNVFHRIILFFRHGFSATLIRRRRTTHPPSKKNSPTVNPNPSSVKNLNHSAVIIHRSRGYKVGSFISSALKVTLPMIK